MKNVIITFPENILSDCAFRNKIDIIKLCIKYVKFAPLAYTGKDVKGSSILCIDKMRRLFVLYGSSIHSVHFPFSVRQDENNIIFYYENYDLDAKTTSLLLDFFERYDELGSMEDMYDVYLKLLDDYSVSGAIYENDLWKLICYLLIFEPAYLRYDEDFSTEKELEKHPRYHLDINYSNTSTYKIGLRAKISIEEYINILDRNKNCVFVSY